MNNQKDNMNELDKKLKDALYDNRESIDLEKPFNLIKMGADPNVSCGGKTLLHYLCKCPLDETNKDNIIQKVTSLLTECEANPDGTSPNVEYSPPPSPLCDAIKQNSTELIKLLLENRADPNLSTGDGSRHSRPVALKFAIETNDERIVELLLESGAIPGKQDISAAAERGRDYNILKLILNYKKGNNFLCNRETVTDGLDLTLSYLPQNSSEMISAMRPENDLSEKANKLCMAIDGNDLKKVKGLIVRKNGKSLVSGNRFVNLRDSTGELPIIVACQSGNKKIIDLLIKDYAAKLDYTNSKNENVLHILCDPQYADSEILEYLCNYPSIDCKPSQDRTRRLDAIKRKVINHYPGRSHPPDVLKRIINQKDDTGNTPLQKALSIEETGERAKIISLLVHDLKAGKSLSKERQKRLLDKDSQAIKGENAPREKVRDQLSKIGVEYVTSGKYTGPKEPAKILELISETFQLIQSCIKEDIRSGMKPSDADNSNFLTLPMNLMPALSAFSFQLRKKAKDLPELTKSKQRAYKKILHLLPNYPWKAFQVFVHYLEHNRIDLRDRTYGYRIGDHLIYEAFKKMDQNRELIQLIDVFSKLAEDLGTTSIDLNPHVLASVLHYLRDEKFYMHIKEGFYNYTLCGAKLDSSENRARFLSCISEIGEGLYQASKFLQSHFEEGFVKDTIHLRHFLSHPERGYNTYQILEVIDNDNLTLDEIILYINHPEQFKKDHPEQSKEEHPEQFKKAHPKLPEPNYLEQFKTNSKIMDNLEYYSIPKGNGDKIKEATNILSELENHKDLYLEKPWRASQEDNKQKEKDVDNQFIDIKKLKESKKQFEEKKSELTDLLKDDRYNITLKEIENIKEIDTNIVKKNQEIVRVTNAHTFLETFKEEMPQDFTRRKGVENKFLETAIDPYSLYSEASLCGEIQGLDAQLKEKLKLSEEDKSQTNNNDSRQDEQEKEKQTNIQRLRELKDLIKNSTGKEKKNFENEKTTLDEAIKNLPKASNQIKKLNNDISNLETQINEKEKKLTELKEFREKHGNKISSEIQKILKALKDNKDRYSGIKNSKEINNAELNEKDQKLLMDYENLQRKRDLWQTYNTDLKKVEEDLKKEFKEEEARIEKEYNENVKNSFIKLIDNNFQVYASKIEEQYNKLFVFYYRQQTRAKGYTSSGLYSHQNDIILRFYLIQAGSIIRCIRGNRKFLDFFKAYLPQERLDTVLTDLKYLQDVRGNHAHSGQREDGKKPGEKPESPSQIFIDASIKVKEISFIFVILKECLKSGKASYVEIEAKHETLILAQQRVAEENSPEFLDNLIKQFEEHFQIDQIDINGVDPVSPRFDDEIQSRYDGTKLLELRKMIDHVIVTFHKPIMYFVVEGCLKNGKDLPLPPNKAELPQRKLYKSQQKFGEKDAKEYEN